MAEKCRFIARVEDLLTGGSADGFMVDFAKLKGDPDKLDVCDLDFYQSGVKTSFSTNQFIKDFGKGLLFKPEEAARFLALKAGTVMVNNEELSRNLNLPESVLNGHESRDFLNSHFRSESLIRIATQILKEIVEKQPVDECHPIANIETDLFGVSPFEGIITDVAKLRGKKETLDTCDLSVLKNDLRVSLDNESFIAEVGQGSQFNSIKAVDRLQALLKNASEEDRLHVSKHHLSEESRQNLDAIWQNAFKASLTAGNKSYYQSKIRLIENFFSDPEIAAIWESLGLREEEALEPLHPRGHLEREEWDILAKDLSTWDNWMPVIYNRLNSKMQKRVTFWENCSLIYNRVTRSLLAVGSGIFAGVAASPAAVPVALALFEFSDSAGEELAKASWQKNYTFAEARWKIAYHAPFSLAKGLSFQAGPWVGAAVYGGVTALEVGGEPLPYEVSFKDRLKAAGMHGGYAFSSSASWMVTLRWFMPAFFKFFRFTPSPELFPKRTRTVPEPLPATTPLQPGTRVALSVESTPPITPPAPQPAVSIRPSAPRVAPVRLVPPPKAGCTIQKAAPAEEAFGKLSLPMREKLDGLISQIKRALEAGTQLEQMRGVKAVNRQEGVWETTVFSPQKAKVLFKVEGTSGEQKIEILGYSVE